MRPIQEYNYIAIASSNERRSRRFVSLLSLNPAMHAVFLVPPRDSKNKSCRVDNGYGFASPSTSSTFRLIQPRTTASARRQTHAYIPSRPSQKPESMARTLLPWSWLRFCCVIHPGATTTGGSGSEY